MASFIPSILAKTEKIQFSDPFAIPDFISRDEQKWLLKKFNEVRQDHGAGHNFMLRDDNNPDIAELIARKIRDVIDLDQYSLFNAAFVRLVDKPGPHIDCRTILDKDSEYFGHTILSSTAGKQIFLPLCVDDNDDVDEKQLREIITIFTGQRWFGYGTNFLKGIDAPISWVNPFRKAVTDYEGLHGKSKTAFDIEIFKKYLSPQVNYESLDGLSADFIFPWELRKAIISDASTIHMASNHELAGVSSKTFINIHLDHRFPESFL